MNKQQTLDHLQILFRNKNDRVTQALAAFFTPKPQEDIFPMEVVTPRGDVWVFLESGSEPQVKGMVKTWAIYQRVVEDDGLSNTSE